MATPRNLEAVSRLQSQTWTVLDQTWTDLQSLAEALWDIHGAWCLGSVLVLCYNTKWFRCAGRGFNPCLVNIPCFSYSEVSDSCAYSFLDLQTPALLTTINQNCHEENSVLLTITTAQRRICRVVVPVCCSPVIIREKTVIGGVSTTADDLVN